MRKAKLDKYIEYITTKIKILYKEKKFKSNGYELKYILEKNDSNSLIVILSGIPRQGLKARYNYGRTLSNIKANKLFILDDFGYDHRGAFYLGKDKDFKIQEAVKYLIIKIKSDLNTNRTFYVGSSKGGFASIYFGLQDKGSTIIAGGPQYILGDHLTKGIYPKYTLPYILGENYTRNDIEYLNDIVRNVVHETKGNNCDIYLHYSDSEYTYERHVVPLLEDLKANNIKFYEDVEHYKKHAEIAYYFPSFLVKTLKKALEESYEIKTLDKMQDFEKTRI